VSMKFVELLKELDDLDLPKNQYAITASGSLAVRGIRDSKDIDIIVTEELWERIASKYEVKKEKFSMFNAGSIQVLGNGSNFTNPVLKSTREQIENADVVDGRRYVKLETVKKFKKDLGRDKDIRDIELIDAYIKENTSTL